MATEPASANCTKQKPLVSPFFSLGKSIRVTRPKPPNALWTWASVVLSQTPSTYTLRAWLADRACSIAGALQSSLTARLTMFWILLSLRWGLGAQALAIVWKYLLELTLLLRRQPRIRLNLSRDLKVR